MTRCKECSKDASFGYSDIGERLYCGKHKLENMISGSILLQKTTIN